MTKRSIAIAAVALCLGSLAGCTAASQAEPASTSPSARVAVKNVVTPTPTATHNPDWGKYTQDEFYLVSLKADGSHVWPGGRPSDDVLIADAHKVCAALTNGTPRTEVKVFGAEPTTPANVSIITYAIHVYCPQFKPKVPATR